LGPNAVVEEQKERRHNGLPPIRSGKSAFFELADGKSAWYQLARYA
jgi:hypothetical protein